MFFTKGSFIAEHINGLTPKRNHISVNIVRKVLNKRVIQNLTHLVPHWHSETISMSILSEIFCIFCLTPTRNHINVKFVGNALHKRVL